MIVCISGVGDLLLEERAMAAKADLFEDIYGMKVAGRGSDAWQRPVEPCAKENMPNA